MIARGRTICSRTVVLISGVVFLLTAAGPAVADPIAPNFLTTEMMMENLGVNIQGIGRLLGVDDTVSLSLTTYTDPDNLAFLFALDPGQSYNDTPLTLAGSGAFNPAESRWEGQATATADGAPLFTAEWTCDVTGTDEYVGEYQWIADLGTRLEIDAEGSLTWSDDGNGGIYSAGSGRLTVDGITVASVSGTDHLRWTSPWTWFAAVDPPEAGTPDQYFLTGSSPESGGYGPARWVPEPASLTLLAMGLLFRPRRRS